MNSMTRTMNTICGTGTGNPAILGGAKPTRSGVRLKFRRAHLETVLNYLRDSAGLIIYVRPGVETERTVDLWHDKPVSAADALALLKEALIEMGCTLVRKGSLFNVIPSGDVKKYCIPLPTV